MHSISYNVTFIVLQNSVLDFIYSMLFNTPWLKDAKVSCELVNNIITIQKNGIMKTLTITRCLINQSK